MARLNDFRKRVEAGHAVVRWNGYGSALVFKLDGMYFVGTSEEEDGTLLDTWEQVLKDLGPDWAEAEDWQRYVLTEVAR